MQNTGRMGAIEPAHRIENQIADALRSEPLLPGKPLCCVQIFINRRLDFKAAFPAYRVVDLVDGRPDYELHLAASVHHANHFGNRIELGVICKPLVLKNEAQTRHAMRRA